MDTKEARLILEQLTTDRSEVVDRIYEGLVILHKHRHKGFDYSFRHDQVFAADFDTTVETMTEDEVIRMACLGWFEDEDSWSHF